MQYYVNKDANPNGDHEVHYLGCSHFPKSRNTLRLGSFFKCREALEAAKKRYRQVNGCPHCCSDCYRK